MDVSKEIKDEAKARLVAMRALLADPKRWCKDVNARDENGDQIAANDEGACSWCLHGAMCKAARDRDGFIDDGATIAIELLLNECCKSHPVATKIMTERHASFVNVNDDPTTTHETVLAIIDCSVAKVA